jgi:hypothetical protein
MALVSAKFSCNVLIASALGRIAKNLALLSFALHFFHDWQRPSASADYKSPAFPGYFLFD